MTGSNIAAEAEAGILEALGATGPSTQAVILRQGTPGGDSHNPTEGTPEGFACVAFQSRKRQSDLQNTKVATCDKVMLVGASSLTITPTTADRFQQDGVSMEIVDVDTIAPAGVPLLHRLFLEGETAADVYVPGVEATPVGAFETFVVDHTDDAFSLVVPANTRTLLSPTFVRSYTNGPAIYDSHDFFPGGEFDPIGNEPGGQYEIELTFDVNPTVIDTNIVLSIDIGSPDDPIEAISVPIVGAVGVTHKTTIPLDVYSRETFQANNAQFFIEATNAITLTAARAKVTVERIS